MGGECSAVVPLVPVARGGSLETLTQTAPGDCTISKAAPEGNDTRTWWSCARPPRGVKKGERSEFCYTSTVQY
jgi:hypothetical protein